MTRISFAAKDLVCLGTGMGYYNKTWTAQIKQESRQEGPIYENGWQRSEPAMFGESELGLLDARPTRELRREKERWIVNRPWITS